MEETLTLEQLIAGINSDDPDTRTAAWQAAGSVGAPAIKPMAKIVVEGELEVGRAAKRAMWKIVRTAGAPKADAADKKAVIQALIVVLLDESRPAVLRRDVIWMLSEIGGQETIDAFYQIPDLLHKDICEDARCCAERIPIESAVAALKDALEEAPPALKPAIAHSLRVRGVAVPSVPDLKLVPTKETTVKPVEPPGSRQP